MAEGTARIDAALKRIDAATKALAAAHHEQIKRNEALRVSLAGAIATLDSIIEEQPRR
ncbi:hypothetical protein ACLB0R_10375 [Sphingomonas sp. GlSt437]|uniref:hypothetical protein n=1 Tax=Sphingomonas sp. GlSt437 TaxID=3389970 RepID=UPI003A8B06F5